MPDDRVDTVRCNSPKPWPEDGECKIELDRGDGTTTFCFGKLRLCEGGYIRTWSLEVSDEDGVYAVFHGLEDFTDDGDCLYWVECSSCLQRYEVPDEWGWD